MEINPGFDVARLASMNVDLGISGYDEPRGREFQRMMQERAASVAGVQSATLASFAPLIGGGFARTVFLAGQDTKDPRNGRLVEIQTVGDSYFQTMGIRLLKGRTFAPSDLPSIPRVAVINETMAKRFWPGRDPIGERYSYFGVDHPLEVVGVVVALLLARLIGGLLYGVGAADPLTFIAVPAALVAAALAASYVPARRAAAVDPLVALRNE
jgi:ABC-type antimicrobial peptide transport system permease subunit